MNTPVIMTKPTTPPCFGTSAWDRNAPECAGGPDASYVNSEGKNVRSPCDFFQSCGNRAVLGGRTIPPSQLVRPPVVTPPPAPPTFPTQTHAPPATSPSFSEFIRRVDAERQAKIGQNPMGQPAAQPYAHPATHQAASWVLNYAMPAYLSTPEVQHPGETVWQVLLREVIRSLFKAGGHAIAHFFDARPLKNSKE
jgi:hypothetical protein